MKVAILAPWRTDDGPRAAVWKVCRARWEALFPDWPVFQGRSPDGPFNRSAAINDAHRQAGDRDVYLVIDADVMVTPGNVRAAVERAHMTGRVTWAHRRWRGITEEATKRLTRPDPKWAEAALGKGGIERSDFTDADIDLIIEKTTRMSWSCCIAVSRQAWETIGGFDERFAGWGFEDLAFQAASGGLVGWDRIEGDVLNFHHPRVPGAGRADKTGSNYTPQALVNGRLGMRYMVALRRDHRLTDRPDPADDAEIARDIGNLKRQDAEFGKDQHPAERRVWEDWWPTLEELRAGALDMTIGPAPGAPTVTVILHTGGTPDRWPERREYLRRSLASLVENVTGPIVQSVIYDCWGDPDIRAQIREMAPDGWYVVGPDERPDFTGSMQAMWRYIAKRAKGEFVFQVEDDFTYARPVDLEPMIAVLRREPHLAQMALLRDACYQDERDAEAIGNILGWPRPAFTFRDGWFEHRQFFTLNPSLFRRSLTERPWPGGHHSETLFGKALYRDPRIRSGFWGAGEEWITHIGEIRAGAGY